MDRLLGWRERLAGDQRVVAFCEDSRYRVLFAVAICKDRRAANGLLQALWADGCPGAAMRQRIASGWSLQKLPTL